MCAHRSPHLPQDFDGQHSKSSLRPLLCDPYDLFKWYLRFVIYYNRLQELELLVRYEDWISHLKLELANDVNWWIPLLEENLIKIEDCQLLKWLV